jgi:NAD(P)-dependent dehydrogenase (short-subunit alcohol dehydrogenase family)
MLDFTNKVVFVAGAGSIAEGWGNGRAAAAVFARQGAKVYGVDLNQPALDTTGEMLAAEGLTNWAGSACDMTRTEQVEAAVADCLAKYGRIDVLVNNIGGSAPGNPVSMSVEDWDRQMDFNLKTAFLGCKHVIPVMERQFERNGHGGSIVNVSSMAHLRFQVEGRVHVAYSASKAGVVAFSNATAIAYVRKGIRVNTVIVGMMNTPLVKSRLAAQLGEEDSEALVAKRNGQVPMGRMGEAWDAANAIVFLASDEAAFITGTQLIVDGGMSVGR